MIVSAEMPTSMPTIRDDHDEGARHAVHVVVGEGEQRGIDRGEGETEAEAAGDQGEVGDRLLERGQPPLAISTNPAAASSIPAAVTTPGEKRRMR